MQKRLLKLIVLVSLALTNRTIAQQMDEVIEEELLPGRYPTYTNFQSAPLLFKKDEVILKDEKGRISRVKDVLLTSVEKDPLGYEHYRYQQTYNGIPVEHAIYVVHVKDGNKVMAGNGKMIKSFSSDLPSRVTINISQALSVALDNINAREYKWNIPDEEAFLKEEQKNPAATYYPKGELVYYSGDEDVIPAKLCLAYKFDIYAHYPVSRSMVYIDATTGRILGKHSLISNCHNDIELPNHVTANAGCDENAFFENTQQPSNILAPSLAITGYSGVQQIMSLKLSDWVYLLRESYGGKNIQTLNMKKAGTNYGAAVDFVNPTNLWSMNNADLDQYALDVHWGTEKTFDYYKQKFNRLGVDNAGFTIKNYVHTDLMAQGFSSNNNAYWDGKKASYGDGGLLGDYFYKPCTSIDIVGHELTHGVTHTTSNLVYKYESGALSEGFSDIFGTCIEFYSKLPGKANWLIAEDIGPYWRDMSNPNIRSSADTYKGYLWREGEADYGGVHNNSGVLNYWFYLLVNGGSGVNDNGRNYFVKGIGMDKAAAIAYRLNTVYLVSTSGYKDARKYGIIAAEDLFGKNSEEAIQTTNAWIAVMGSPMKKAPNVDKDPFKIFPNPIIGNQFFIEFEKENDGIDQVVISDLTGKTIYTKNVRMIKGNNKIPIDFNKPENGMYLIRIGEKTIKLLVQ